MISIRKTENCIRGLLYTLTMPIAQLSRISGDNNLSEKAAAVLRQAIKDGTLQPGTHLVEQDVAEQLGISRMPIREAIQQLISEGLVIKERRHGAYVHPFTAKELEEVYSIRVLLERFTVERAIAHWSPETSRTLRSLVVSMQAAGLAGDKDRILELDSQFHEVLWKTAHHDVLLDVVSSLRSRISRFLYEATRALTTEALDEHVKTHSTLLDVLENKDVAAAQEAISAHIMAAKDRIRDYYAYLDT